LKTVLRLVRDEDYEQIESAVSTAEGNGHAGDDEVNEEAPHVDEEQA